VFRENGAWALALRVMPAQVPSFQDLRLPPAVKVLCEPGPGLVLITGPTGSGKSTTAASMLQHAAASEARHIVTIEDPIEYRLPDSPSCVTQREVGRDAASYKEALTSVLREDPDLLFVGEIRDAESLQVAIQAAETGHHVISTFHTSTAMKTVQRLLAMLSGDDQQVSRVRLADALRGVICQRLLPRKGGRGHGRILCCEVMMNNYAIVECIKDPAKLVNIPAVIERSADQLMQTFDKSLVKLVADGLVDPEVAVAFATNPGEIRRHLRMPGLET
jgi:twitching motility protein PilT